jgi:hypothetical protein
MGLVLDAVKLSSTTPDSARHLLPGIFEFLLGVIKMDATLLLPELPLLLSLCSAALHAESSSQVAHAAASILQSTCDCCCSLYRFDSLIQAAAQVLTEYPVQRVHCGSDEWSNRIAACVSSNQDAEVVSKCICTLCDLIVRESTALPAASSLCMLLQAVVCRSSDIRSLCVIDACSSSLLSAIQCLFERGGKCFLKSLSSGRVSDGQQLCVAAAMQLLAQSVISRIGLHSLFPVRGCSILQPFVENQFPIDFSELSCFVSSSCDSTNVGGILSPLILASVAIQCAAASLADVLCRFPLGVPPPTQSVAFFATGSDLASSALSIASRIRNCKVAALSSGFRDASSSCELEQCVWQLIQAQLRSLCHFCSDSSLIHIWIEILSHVAGGCMSTHVQRLLCDPYFYDISSLRAAASKGVGHFVQQHRGTSKNWHSTCKTSDIIHVCSFLSALPSQYMDDGSMHSLIVLCLEIAAHHFSQTAASSSVRKKGKSNPVTTELPASLASLIYAAASLAHAFPSAVYLVAADGSLRDLFSSALVYFCADNQTSVSELSTACCCLLQRLSTAAVHTGDTVAQNKDLIDFFDFFIGNLISCNSLICSQFALSILQGVDCKSSSRYLPPSFRTLSPLSEKHLLMAWSQNRCSSHLLPFAQCLAIRRRLQVTDDSDALVATLPALLADCAESCAHQNCPSLQHATHVASFLAEYVQILPALQPQPRPAVLLTVFGIATVLEHHHPATGIQIINSMLSCSSHSTATTLLKATMSLLNPSRIPFDEMFASSCSRIFTALYCGPRWQQRMKTLEKSVEAVICLCGGAAVSCCTNGKFDCASVFMSSLSSVVSGSQSLAVPLHALRCALDCSLAVFQQLCAPADSDGCKESDLAATACSWM